MRETQLRSLLAYVLLAGHVAIPALLVILYAMDGLTRDELKELLQIVGPLVATLSAYGFGHMIANREAAAQVQPAATLSRGFVIVTVAFTVGFLLLISTFVVFKAWNIALRSFSDLKLLLAAAESVFGVGTGRLLDALFTKRGIHETVA